ncbi:hypothetical protein QL985_09830, partial [Kocuria sp. APC 4018]|nr:hypothetical protein [Kocuria sp. APC 4018]
MSAAHPGPAPRTAQGPGAQQASRPGTTGTERTPSPEAGHTPELRWAGTHAFLLDCGELADVMRWHAHLTAHPFAGQGEHVVVALSGAPVGARITGGETERSAPFCAP